MTKKNLEVLNAVYRDAVQYSLQALGGIAETFDYEKDYAAMPTITFTRSFERLLESDCDSKEVIVAIQQTFFSGGPLVIIKSNNQYVEFRWQQPLALYELWNLYGVINPVRFFHMCFYLEYDYGTSNNLDVPKPIKEKLEFPAVDDMTKFNACCNAYIRTRTTWYFRKACELLEHADEFVGWGRWSQTTERKSKVEMELDALYSKGGIQAVLDKVLVVASCMPGSNWTNDYYKEFVKTYKMLGGIV